MVQLTFHLSDDLSAAIDMAVGKRAAMGTRPRPSRSAFAREALAALIAIETGFTAGAAGVAENKDA